MWAVDVAVVTAVRTVVFDGLRSEVSKSLAVMVAAVTWSSDRRWSAVRRATFLESDGATAVSSATAEAIWIESEPSTFDKKLDFLLYAGDEDGGETAMGLVSIVNQR